MGAHRKDRSFITAVTATKDCDDAPPFSNEFIVASWAEWCEAHCNWIVKVKRMIAKVVYEQKTITVHGVEQLVDICFIQAKLTPDIRNGERIVVPVLAGVE